MFTVKTYHSDVLKAIIPVVESLNVYGFLNMHIFLLCKCTIYESTPFIIIHITLPSSTIDTIANKMPGPGRRKKKKTGQFNQTGRRDEDNA